jgi:drug/metabolite transporter (DMT)-like permease
MKLDMTLARLDCLQDRSCAATGRKLRDLKATPHVHFATLRLVHLLHEHPIGYKDISGRSGLLSNRELDLRKIHFLIYVCGPIRFAAHVPAGVLSITIGMVPIMTFVASAFIRLEKFEIRRVFGVVLGSVSVVLLVAPNSSLPDPAQLPWLLLGFAAAGCYAALSLVIALLAPPKSNSLVLTCGMFIAASFLMIPILYVTGSFAPFGWPWGAVEWSMLGLGIINAVAYALYFSLVDRAGPVFSSFTANLVTLFGVFWGIVIFAEENSVWVWLSFLTIMGALALVTPRGRAAA